MTNGGRQDIRRCRARELSSPTRTHGSLSRSRDVPSPEEHAGIVEGDRVPDPNRCHVSETGVAVDESDACMRECLVADPTWTDVMQAVGAVSIPIVVAGLAFVLSRSQSRSGELLKVRLDYYRTLAPDLNQLMCYMTFIGTWRENSPPEIIDLKRRLDRTFFCAAPLFSTVVLEAYIELMNATFETFADWGEDAKIRSNAYRRRQSWRGAEGWDSAWDGYFTLDDSATISGADLWRYRELYDALVAKLVGDLDVTRARSKYTTDEVSLNAHAPQRIDVTGAR